MEINNEGNNERSNTKNNIREKYKLLRNKLTEDEVNLKSCVIVEKFLKTRIYANSNTIHTYISVNNEVDTISLIKQSLEDNKRIAIPKVVGLRKMSFYYINSIDNLKRGKYNILEPRDNCEEVTLQPETIIIPGVAFDINRNRLGYGGGYYDTYLQKHKKAKKIAFAYDFQVIEKLPIDTFDIPMDRVITEKRTL